MDEALTLDQKSIKECLLAIDPASTKTEIRSAGYKTLLKIAEEQPETLLPYWDRLAALLHCGNGSTQYIAVHLLAPLARGDRDGRLDDLLDDFFSLLDDKSVMVASHTAAVAGQIALAQPQLQERITKKLFGIPQTHFDAERKGLVAGYAIGSFEEYFEQAGDQDEIAAFIRRQLNSASPKTRKMAAAFLKKWGYTSKL
ncbi:MAG: hypothetical protein AB9891_05390 [Anaerolineaceae bacterium]